MQKLFTNPSAQIKGQVRFVLGQTLWVQNLTIADSSEMKPRQKLIEKKFALEDLNSSAKIEQLMQENKQKERIAKEFSSNKIKLNLFLENSDEKKNEQILRKPEKNFTNLITNICKPQPKVDIQTKQADVNFTEDDSQQDDKTIQVPSSDGKVVYDINIEDINAFIEIISKADNKPKTAISEVKEFKENPSNLIEIEETKSDTHIAKVEQKPNSVSYTSNEAESSEFDDREYESMLLKRFEKEANDLLAEIQKPSRTSLTWSLPLKKKATVAWGQDELFIYLKIYDDDIDKKGFYLRCFAQVFFNSHFLFLEYIFQF